MIEHNQRLLYLKVCESINEVLKRTRLIKGDDGSWDKQNDEKTFDIGSTLANNWKSFAPLIYRDVNCLKVELIL